MNEAMMAPRGLITSMISPTVATATTHTCTHTKTDGNQVTQVTRPITRARAKGLHTLILRVLLDNMELDKVHLTDPSWLDTVISMRPT